MTRDRTSPAWRPTRETRVWLPEICVMHGGPVGMHLAEHEHAEVQLETHFVAERGNRTSLSAERVPRYFTLIPSCMPHVGRWDEGTEVIVALLPRTQLEEAADELLRRSTSEIVSRRCAVDPVIHSLADALRREFLSGHVTDSMFVRAVGTVLAGTLVRRWSARPQERPVKGGLSSRHLRTTLDTMEDCLGESVSVPELAAQLKMGVHQFTRQFKNSTGQTPYQYVMQRRVERALTLLENTSRSIATIALDLGFVSQSHFTSVFRKRMHVTPHAYRKFCAGK